MIHSSRFTKCRGDKGDAHFGNIRASLVPIAFLSPVRGESGDGENGPLLRAMHIEVIIYVHVCTHNRTHIITLTLIP